MKIRPEIQAEMERVRRVSAMRPSFDPKDILWTVVDKVNNHEDVALSDDDRQRLEDQYFVMNGALGSAIEDRTRIGREIGERYSTFDCGLRASLGSDDHFTDFIDYLLSLGCDACRAVVEDPQAFVPPRNWTHFKFASRDAVHYPRTMENFLGKYLS